jgi:hypothetical protein
MNQENMFPKIEKSEIIQLVNEVNFNYPGFVIELSDKTIYQCFIKIHIVSNRFNDNQFQALKKAFEKIHTTPFSIEVIENSLAITFHIC